MPLYDCLLLMKPHVRKEAVMDLVGRVSRRVYQRNGVVTDMKSFGTIQLGYGIKKLDGRHYQPAGIQGPSSSRIIPREPSALTRCQGPSSSAIARPSSSPSIRSVRDVNQTDQGQLMQMTVMVPPTFNDELKYLNKEDRLLRWLVVKHRDAKYGMEFINEDDGRDELSMFNKNGVLHQGAGDDDAEEDDDEDYDNDEDEPQVE